MESIAFPKMFKNSSTMVIKDHEATSSNYKLLLLSDKNTLLGDPYFGTGLKELFWEQGDSLLKDIVVDNILSATTIFMPQLLVNRKDISLVTNRQDLYVKLKAINLLDYQLDTFNISLTDYEEK